MSQGSVTVTLTTWTLRALALVMGKLDAMPPIVALSRRSRQQNQVALTKVMMSPQPHRRRRSQQIQLCPVLARSLLALWTTP
jgi:hypothetical protein